MDHTSSQISVKDLSPAIEWSKLATKSSRYLNILLAETITIMVIVIVAIKSFQTSVSLHGYWFAVPCIFLAGAIIPKVIRERVLPKPGLSFGQIKSSLAVLGWVCPIVFSAMFCGLWILNANGIGFPLVPIVPQSQAFLNWVVFQFLYVAVAEEMFFRGYLQGNILNIFGMASPERHRMQCCLTIVVSAVCFAIAHMLLHGQIIYVLTIVPGMLLGWLRIRTKSLLAPILFHGLANTCYYVLAGLLTK